MKSYIPVLLLLLGLVQPAMADVSAALCADSVAADPAPPAPAPAPQPEEEPEEEPDCE